MSKLMRFFSSPANDPVKKTAEVSLEPASATHILDLNNHCLGIVFSFLSPNDLWAVKETCRRFGPEADCRFQRNYSDTKFEMCGSAATGTVADSRPISRKHLLSFGKFVHHLLVWGIRSKDDAHIWRDIREYCTHLKRLKVLGSDLRLFDVPEERIELDGLSLFHNSGNDKDVARFIDYFANFKALEIACDSRKRPRGVFLQEEFRGLETVRFRGFGEREYFNEFFRLNPQIVNANVAPDKLNAIAKHCPNIENITVSFLYYGSGKIAGLNRLSKLKSVSFNGCERSVIESLARNKTLETVALFCETMDMRLCHALCKLTTLTTLSSNFCYGFDTYMLKKLASGTNLENITIDLCENVDYEDIAVVIKHSQRLKTVKFFLHPIMSVSVFDEMRFLQLVNARKESRANFPLEFIRSAAAEKKQAFRVSDEVIAANAHFVKLIYV